MLQRCNWRQSYFGVLAANVATLILAGVSPPRIRTATAAAWRAIS
jgi:hypothetical protein